MLSSYQAYPIEGHLEQIYHVCAFLKKNPKLTLYFYQIEPLIEPSLFQGDSVQKFKDKYQDAEEQLPPSQMCPETIGVPVSTPAYVDSPHTANKVTRRGHTVFIIFVNRAPIICYIKRQNTVEASTFSGDFIAAKSCVEHITSLRFKLRILGIPVVESTKIICHN